MHASELSTLPADLPAQAHPWGGGCFIYIYKTHYLWKGACLVVSKQLAGWSWFSRSTLWVAGMELRPFDLAAASSLTH